MAALVLSAAGAAAGSAVFGPVGAIAGRLVGALAGNAIDQALFASRREVSQDGPRLADLDVMASTEGAPIPRVYGRARLSGQVIWATKLEEVVTPRHRPRAPAAAKAGRRTSRHDQHDDLHLLRQSRGRPVRRTDRRDCRASGPTASRSISPV